MSLDRLKARDERARRALIEYTRGAITETVCRDELSAAGWGHPNIEKIITAVKANIVKV